MIKLKTMMLLVGSWAAAVLAEEIPDPTCEVLCYLIFQTMKIQKISIKYR